MGGWEKQENRGKIAISASFCRGLEISAALESKKSTCIALQKSVGARASGCGAPRGARTHARWRAVYPFTGMLWEN